MTRVFATCACAVLLLLGLATSVDAKRLALVIGNSVYEHAPKLPNPANDARDLAEAFAGLGYEVRLLEDATRSELLDALRSFRAQSQGAEHSIIYYAGHGVEIARQNFVIPVDAELEADIDIDYEAVPLDLLVNATSGAADLQLVVLDACRDNPFLEQMTRTLATRSIGRGLALYEPEGNSLVAYAAKEGTVALDGRSGDNSPYAAAFLEALSKPDLEIGQFFREVRDSVIRKTQGAQEPFLYGSLSADPVYFRPPSTDPDVGRETARANPDGSQPNRASQDTLLAIDVAFWESIRGSDQPNDYRDYLERFPDGEFRPLAERRLAALSPTDAPARSSQEPPVRAEPIPPRAESDPEPVAPSEEIRLSRSEVRDLQARLNILGFSAGVEDGLIGPRTLRAVAAFRDDAGIGGGDRIDRALIDAIEGEVSWSRLAAYRDRARQQQPTTTARPQATPSAKPSPSPAPAAAPKPAGNLGAFVGRTYCRKKGSLIENGQYFSDRPIRCYTILQVSQNAVRYRVTSRQQYGLPIQNSVFTRPRTGTRSYPPVAFPAQGSGYITAEGSTYVASSIHR